MTEKCIHGYTTKEEIQQHFCESDESMKICNNCKFLEYDGSGTMSCKNGEDSNES